MFAGYDHCEASAINFADCLWLRPARASVFSMSRTSALPMIAASANAPTARTCSAFEMPKPTAIGSSVNSAQTRDQLRRVACNFILFVCR